MKPVRAMLVGLVSALVLAGLVATASAAWLSSSELALIAGWERMDIAGGFGTVECTLVLENVLHRSIFTKTVNSLIGYVQYANISSCRRGSATVLRETLPWHIRYRSFTGILPRLTSLSLLVTGIAFRIREPIFGFIYLTGPGQSMYETMNIGSGVVSSVSLGGNITTEAGISGTVSGTSSSVLPTVTIRLI